MVLLKSDEFAFQGNDRRSVRICGVRACGERVETFLACRTDAIALCDGEVRQGIRADSRHTSLSFDIDRRKRRGREAHLNLLLPALFAGNLWRA